jgi:hypothetical protein
MSNQPNLAEVHRLMDVLDNTRLGPPPRAEIEKLHSAYVNARRAEERWRYFYGGALLLLVFAWLGAGFANGALYRPDWMTPVMLAVVFLNLVALNAFPFFLPVLQRRERVVSLLDYFDSDLSAVDRLSARKTAPQNVLIAIEALERAQRADDLGPAYTLVERWHGGTRGVDFDGLYMTLLWITAMLVAVLGGQLGVPDMWRGVLLGAAGMAAFYHLNGRREERGVRRRAEDALGRWRHLVPNMRELPQ